MAQFHPLIVTDIKRTTKDAIAVTLQPSDGTDFSFVQGQYLTFRAEFDGQELRRSYSICAGLDDEHLRIGIKRVDGGAFSTWANETLKFGDTLHAMQPMGNFHTPLDETASNHYLAFASGSGITPILSILRSVLIREPMSRFTFVYANRNINSVMFRDELEDLKNLHMKRLNIIHILSQDANDIDLFSGRIDAEKLDALFTHWIDLSTITTAFICGPEELMQLIANSLQKKGFPEGQIKYELFGTAQPGRARRRAASTNNFKTAEVSIKVTQNGETRSYKVARDRSLLGGAIDNNIDPPFACTAGVCSTCRAKVLEGRVEMVANHALEDYEVERGFVLTCQSFPLTNRVVFDYDQ